MTSSLVGSEMCIRDRFTTQSISSKWLVRVVQWASCPVGIEGCSHAHAISCLLYTSDAADDM
eukprot:10249436-Prorocentrum_lima.AAC.1